MSRSTGPSRRSGSSPSSPVEEGTARRPAVPAAIRRRVLNAPLANTVLSQAGWTLAGVFYLVYLKAVVGLAGPSKTSHAVKALA